MIVVTWIFIVVLVLYTMLMPFTILLSLINLLQDILQALIGFLDPKRKKEK